MFVSAETKTFFKLIFIDFSFQQINQEIWFFDMYEFLLVLIIFFSLLLLSIPQKSTNTIIRGEWCLFLCTQFLIRFRGSGIFGTENGGGRWKLFTLIKSSNPKSFFFYKYWALSPKPNLWYIFNMLLKYKIDVYSIRRDTLNILH